MFVVPFFLRPALSSLIQWNLVPITLFLENHGKLLCTADDPASWLAENGFAVKQIWKEKDTYFAEVDTAATSLADFYSFEQLTKTQQKGTQECWKTFFIMKSKDNEPCSETAWNENIESPFDKTLQAIQDHMKII